MVLGFNRHFSAFMSPAPAPSQSLITSTIQEMGGKGGGRAGAACPPGERAGVRQEGSSQGPMPPLPQLCR